MVLLFSRRAFRACNRALSSKATTRWHSTLGSLAKEPHLRQLERAFNSISSDNKKPIYHGDRKLFGMESMSSPEQFTEEAHQTLNRCRDIVRDLKTLEYSDGNSFIKSIDTLSDMVCSIVDPAECIRHVHHNERWIMAAEEAYDMLINYIGQLNTDSKIYERLRHYAQDPLLGKEEKTIADLMRIDLERHGVNLPRNVRDRVISLTDDISRTGYSFSRLVGSNNTQRTKSALQELLNKRQDLAETLGYKTFAKMNLQDKMAKSPENVLAFINRLNNNASKGGYKEQSMGLTGTYALGSIMRSACLVSELIFGLRMNLFTDNDESAWSDKVKRVDLVTVDDGKKVGTIYFDFSHSGPISAAQYTVRCSRRIDNDPSGAFSARHYQDLQYLGVDSANSEEKLQLPVVVLSCDFPKNGLDITGHDVSTLFHELGHAIHSMCARTRFQHVAGTRGKHDFVEVPSILMEYVIQHPFIVNIINGSYDTKRIDTSPRRNSIEKLQLYFSDVDLALHNCSSIGSDMDKVIRDVNAKYGMSRERLAYFSHLYNYGSFYYSYPWCRVIAQEVYHGLFRTALDSGDLDRIREAGDIWVKEVLSKGGSQDPWSFQWSRILDDESLDRLLLETAK